MTDLRIVEVADIPRLDKIVPVPLDSIEDLQNLVKQMEQVCKNALGIGLAATQVGIPWNLCIVRQGGDFQCYIDCNYEPVEPQKIVSFEGCLSLRNKAGTCRGFHVPRYHHIKIIGKKLLANGQLIDVNFNVSGLDAIVLQHEIDHGFGILISEIGEEVHRDN